MSFDLRDSIRSKLELLSADGVSAEVEVSGTASPAVLLVSFVMSESFEVSSEVEVCKADLTDSNIDTWPSLFFGNVMENFFCGTVVLDCAVDDRNESFDLDPLYRGFEVFGDSSGYDVIFCSFVPSLAPLACGCKGSGTWFSSAFFLASSSDNGTRRIGSFESVFCGIGDTFSFTESRDWTVACVSRRNCGGAGLDKQILQIHLGDC